MYSYSLTWFKGIFRGSMELTNVAKPEVKKQKKQEEQLGLTVAMPEAQTEGARMLSKQDRVDLLI
jgi:hypothetical protein